MTEFAGPYKTCRNALLRLPGDVPGERPRCCCRKASILLPLTWNAMKQPGGGPEASCLRRLVHAFPSPLNCRAKYFVPKCQISTARQHSRWAALAYLPRLNREGHPISAAHLESTHPTEGLTQ